MRKGQMQEQKVCASTPEVIAADVFSTVKQVGYYIEVLRDYSQTMNRYAFLLVE